MTSRTAKKVWLLAGLIIVTGGVAAYYLHFRPKRAVARYQRELLARGEKLTLAEWIPPLLPAERDASAALQPFFVPRGGASTLLDSNYPPSLLMVAPGRAMPGWRRPEIVDLFAKPPATNSWEQIAGALGDEAPLLEALALLVERPNLDWRLDYTQGFDLLLPHLSGMKRNAQRSQAALLLELRADHPAAAVAHLRGLLALAKSSRDERLVISQLVRIAVAAIAQAATWSALQHPGLTDPQLAALQADWQELDFNSSMENALAMERAMSLMTIDRMRESSAAFRRTTGMFGGGSSSGPGGDGLLEQAGTIMKAGWEFTRDRAQEAAWRHSWSLTDELLALRGSQALLETLRQARTNGSYAAPIAELRVRFDQLGVARDHDDDRPGTYWFSDLHSMFSSSLLALSKSADKVMVAESGRALTLTAIALRRYQLKYGHYPPRLAQLTPEFLPAPPRDPHDGQPLRYRVTDHGSFTLYAIGKDGVDDGGDARNPNPKGTLGWQSGRDWVWAQLATEEEFDAHFAAQLAQTRP
jgi:hypothetical protein